MSFAYKFGNRIISVFVFEKSKMWLAYEFGNRIVSILSSQHAGDFLALDERQKQDDKLRGVRWSYYFKNL